jgi:hypothetical protein
MNKMIWYRILCPGAGHGKCFIPFPLSTKLFVKRQNRNVLKTLSFASRNTQIWWGRQMASCWCFLIFNLGLEYSLNPLNSPSSPFQTSKLSCLVPAGQIAKPHFRGMAFVIATDPSHPIRVSCHCSVKGDLCPFWRLPLQGQPVSLVWGTRCSLGGMSFALHVLHWPRTPGFICSSTCHATTFIRKISVYLLEFCRSLSDNTELMEGSYASWIWISLFKLLW